ncbi:putative membrane protein [Pseudomonas fluorescens]|uniref:Putative membrane protein n=1 Tax=Pseudomonas fluorescens TaxID=294 RepID=A0A0P8WIW7_PSEFL|nr:putative membrane protein [Pseudomonas fluorescens]
MGLNILGVKLAATFELVVCVLAVVCLVAMAWFNTLIGLIFLGFMAVGFVYFLLIAQLRADAPADAMLTGL